MSDTTDTVDVKRCPRCGQTKHLDAFGRANGRAKSYCKTCDRIYQSEYRRSERFRAWYASYLAVPAVRERRRWECLEYRRRPEVKARDEARQATPLGRLRRGYHSALRRLRKARAEGRREAAERIAATVALYRAEIDRLTGGLATDEHRISHR